MKKGWIVVSALFIVIVVGLLMLIFVPGPEVAKAPLNNTASIPDLILVNSPAISGEVTSPLTVSGSARGNFYFEASFPIKLKDASGTVVAQGHATAQGDWMTTEFVPFTASITYPAQPAGSRGTLVLLNDNPSGDPIKQKELDIPITFK